MRGHLQAGRVGWERERDEGSAKGGSGGGGKWGRGEAGEWESGGGGERGRGDSPSTPFFHTHPLLPHLQDEAVGLMAQRRYEGVDEIAGPVEREEVLGPHGEGLLAVQVAGWKVEGEGEQLAVQIDGGTVSQGSGKKDSGYAPLQNPPHTR